MMTNKKTSNLPVDPDRLWQDIMALADITDPGKPYTRRSFSTRFLEGRAYLEARFAEAGLAVRIDTAGNLIGRREGSDPSLGTIMVGSHSDTVPSGGRFDGIAGVATGLEVARALADGGTPLRHALEVVDFLAEEPSEFGLSCVGSRGMTGLLEPRMLSFPGPGGELLDSALRRVGGMPDKLDKPLRDDIRAFFELHIEQGPVLEARAIDIGLVTGIVGITRFEIVFEGAADHAGTTPMDLRRDALVAAAQTITAIRAAGERLADEAGGYFVATVGIVEVEPAGANVVPRLARIIVDIRTSERQRTERFIAELDAASTAAAVAARVVRTAFLRLSDTLPTQCDAGLQQLLADGADVLGHSHVPLASGAGHDAAFIAQIAPVAMVFVPCRDGKSHTPEEWAEPEAIAAGAATIFEAVRRFDAAGCTSQTN